jgi:hypothetical protein
MTMNNKLCGNCRNFKPKKKGEKFFNCTSAKQAGINYGMQVRADTRACDAFAPTAPHPTLKDRAKPLSIFPWRTILIVLILAIAIGLLSWFLYRWAIQSEAAPVPTPSPTSTPTGNATPTPTPIPPYIIKDFPISASISAVAPDRMITVYSATRTSSYPLITGAVVTAPPATIFIIFRVSAMNLGSATISIQSSDFRLSDSQGHQFTAQGGGGPYYVGDPFGAFLAPTQTDDGKLLYLVPLQASGFDLSYLLEPASVPPVIARWKLNY